VSLFRKAAEKSRAWVQGATGSFHNGGVSLYQGGAPVPRDAGRVTINGSAPHIPQIWAYYDAVGEFHFDSGFLANCLSRCTLRLGVRDKENKIGPAFDEDGGALPGVPVRLANLGAKMIAGLQSAPSVDATPSGPAGGHGLLLGRTGANWMTAGECYWVATKTAVGDHWEVLSTEEMQPVDTPAGQKQKFRRRRFQGGQWEDFTPNFYLRIYPPHPRYSGESDTAALAMMSTLERLTLLDAEGVADSKSRLKGPGIYWLATEADFPSTDDDPDGDKYMERQFLAAATAGIRDPDSAARHSPIFARAPMAVIKDGIRHDRFDYNAEQLIEKRAAAVGNLARGAPLPYETTTGYGDTSFANAFAIEGQLANIFVAPVLDIITGFLTGGWFTKGLMVATGADMNEPPSDDIKRLCVWYDVSDLVTDPDPTKVAMWAYGSDTNPNSIISAKGVRRLLGIPEGERPSPEETAERAERSQKLRARAEKGAEDTPSNAPDTDPDDGKPKKDQDDDDRNEDEEVGKRVMALADSMVTMAVDTAGSKLRAKCSHREDLKALIDGVDSAHVARTLGAGVVESLGGTGPLFNGTFKAYGRTVLQEFVDAGRPDADELATAAMKMVERAALARLANPAARIDVHLAADFLDQLNQR
jgi:hypothetical protein